MAITTSIFRTVLLALGLSLTVPSALFAQNESLFRAPRLASDSHGLGVFSSSCFPGLSAAPSSVLRSTTASAIPWRTDPLIQPHEFTEFSDACPEQPIPLVKTRPVTASCGFALSAVPGQPGCSPSADVAAPSLAALGKQGLGIQQARDLVLAILGSDNACTEWFQTKEPDPAYVFSSLGFFIDRHGQADVYEVERQNLMAVFLEPYVASATQDGGSFTTITINASGAFYRTQGNVQKRNSEAGPGEWHGTHYLTVGGYLGDTLPARVVTLLHELGHVIDLLPWDGDNLDGHSVRNTDEVLRHCRTEIETTVRSAKDSSKRPRTSAVASTQVHVQP